MKRTLRRGPLLWCAASGRGLHRSAVLLALTAGPPAVAAAVGWGGSLLAYSWSAHLAAAPPVRALATAGETLMVAVWVAVALWVIHPLAGPLGRAARRRAHRWCGADLSVAYRPVPAVTRMATGYWWDGEEYHKSEREARRRARVHARFHDPQLRRDALWSLLAMVTVLPVAALPLLALGAGCWLALGPGPLGCGIALLVAALAAAPFCWRIFPPLAVRFLGPAPGAGGLGGRLAELETVRADLTRTQAAELERIERGLHDGAQARLLSLGMSMEAAELLVDADPAAAKELLAQARASSVAALAELRSLVRGINPPVLTERGLVDAVRALVLDASVETTVRAAVPARPERPVESAVYFAVAELLTNVGKHARATRATVELTHEDGTLSASVTDDGIGGAVPAKGSGLDGLARRMAAFGGRMDIESPGGGPTRITVAVPCALS